MQLHAVSFNIQQLFQTATRRSLSKPIKGTFPPLNEQHFTLGGDYENGGSSLNNEADRDQIWSQS